MEVKNNYDSFDPLAYIENKYSTMSEWTAIPLKGLRDVFLQSYSKDEGGLKVLDYGCGPVPIYMSPAPHYASEIVFADYSKANRDMLKKWLDNEPGCPDYTPIFKYVVQGIEGLEHEDIIDVAVSQRQDDLRSLVKAVVHCDITQDTPIEPGYEGPYDVIYSGLCLSVAATSVQEYSNNIKRLTKLLKPSGKLVINSTEARHLHDTTYTYYVKEAKFQSFSITLDALTRALKENGYDDIKITRSLVDETEGAAQRLSSEVLAMRLIVATKICENKL